MNFIWAYVDSLFIAIYYCYAADSVGVGCWVIENGREYEGLDFTSHVEKGSQKNQLQVLTEEVNHWWCGGEFHLKLEECWWQIWRETNGSHSQELFEEKADVIFISKNAKVISDSYMLVRIELCP